MSTYIYLQLSRGKYFYSEEGLEKGYQSEGRWHNVFCKSWHLKCYAPSPDA